MVKWLSLILATKPGIKLDTELQQFRERWCIIGTIKWNVMSSCAIYFPVWSSWIQFGAILTKKMLPWLHAGRSCDVISEREFHMKISGIGLQRLVLKVTICRIMWQYREFNYSPSFVAYMGQWFGSALVQKMACPFRRQAIIWTNAGLLSIGPLGTYFSELLIKIPNFIHKNASENIVCEMAAICSRGIS